MKSVLISACLLGENCKYNGGNNYNEAAAALAERYELVPVCPEVLGGLSVPRPPCERSGSRVISNDPEGLKDVTEAFVSGARQCLEITKEKGIELAVLKAKSPSCGSCRIYDGTFSHTVIPGDGVTAEMLKANGIRVITEEDL